MSLQSLPQELVGHIFALLPDKDARQSFLAASPVVRRAPSVVDQIKAITVAGSMLVPSGGNPLDTVPEGASLRELTIIFDCDHFNSSYLASCMRDALQGRPGLLAGLEMITINGLEVKDMLLLEAVAQTCYSLRSINIITGRNEGVLGPFILPSNLSDSFACLKGLSEVQLTIASREDDGGCWLNLDLNHLVEALARCTTIRSLVLSDDRLCNAGAGWVQKLVFSLPCLEHLVLNGSESCCTSLRASFSQFPFSHASLRSLRIAKVGIQELANFLFSMSETTTNRFPCLRSLEIQELHDRDCFDTLESITDDPGGLNPWHGRTGNLSISVSDVLNVSERWLFFLIDRGLKLATVQSLKLTCSLVRHSNTDPLFQPMDTEFNEQRARLIAEKLPSLTGLILIHEDFDDHRGFLAGCKAFTQELRRLQRLELWLSCHFPDEFKWVGRMARELCISATSVEHAGCQAPLDVILRISGAPQGDYSPSQDDRRKLKQRLDERVGSHIQSFGSARTVHFHLS